MSSCLSWPSSAKPRFSLLFDNSGQSMYTFDSVPPGPTGKPSLQQVIEQIKEEDCFI